MFIPFIVVMIIILVLLRGEGKRTQADRERVWSTGMARKTPIVSQEMVEWEDRMAAAAAQVAQQRRQEHEQALSASACGYSAGRAAAAHAVDAAHIAAVLGTGGK